MEIKLLKLDLIPDFLDDNFEIPIEVNINPSPSDNISNSFSSKLRNQQDQKFFDNFSKRNRTSRFKSKLKTLNSKISRRIQKRKRNRNLISSNSPKYKLGGALRSSQAEHSSKIKFGAKSRTREFKILYIQMEYCGGKTLKEICNESDINYASAIKR